MEAIWLLPTHADPSYKVTYLGKWPCECAVQSSEVVIQGLSDCICQRAEDIIHTCMMLQSNLTFGRVFGPSVKTEA